MAEKPKPVDKQRLKWLMKTEQWDVVLHFFAYKIGQWNEEKIVGGNAFEELKNLHTQQGKVEGLAEFMDQMEREAME